MKKQLAIFIFTVALLLGMARRFESQAQNGLTDVQLFRAAWIGAESQLNEARQQISQLQGQIQKLQAEVKALKEEK